MNSSENRARTLAAIEIRPPQAADGLTVNQLIDRCPPLNGNSVYCNLLQCSHFADTCAIAKHGYTTVGFISAFIPPQQSDTLFVWQVAVDPFVRGVGLSKKLLQHVLARNACANVQFVECTINEENDSSWALFMSFADALEADTERSVLFDKQRDFNGQHESEILLRIGPFNNIPMNPIEG